MSIIIMISRVGYSTITDEMKCMFRSILGTGGQPTSIRYQSKELHSYQASWCACMRGSSLPFSFSYCTADKAWLIAGR